MIQRLYSVRDNVAKLYLPPFNAFNDGSAIRLFSDSLQKPDSQFAAHKNDYDLHFVGTFDDQTGDISPGDDSDTDPYLIVRGQQVEVQQTLPL